MKRLDALLLTHAEADHEGMALEIVRAFRPRLVLDGGAGWPTAVQRGLRAGRVRTVAAHAGQEVVLGGVRLRLLWPPPPSPGWRPDGNPNDRAVVAVASAGPFDLLLPADAESEVTASLDLPDVEALKVAHHGSADPGLPAFLERTRPEFAAIEVGKGRTPTGTRRRRRSRRSAERCRRWCARTATGPCGCAWRARPRGWSVDADGPCRASNQDAAMVPAILPAGRSHTLVGRQRLRLGRTNVGRQ